MIINIREGELNWLSDISIADIPHPLPSGITIHAKKHEIGLEVQGLTGAIPLKNGDTLQIVPKIGQVNFLRLLFKAEGNQKQLTSEYEDFVNYSIEEEGSIDFLVAKNLILSVDEIMRRSPKQGRILRKNRSTFAAGRVDIVNTALNIASRQQDPVVSFEKSRTLNISENRVLSEAVARAGLILQDANVEPKFIEIKNRWLSKFPRSQNLTSDVAEIEEKFAKAQFGGARDYYRRALMYAQVILGNLGLGLSNINPIEGEAILINTADIFEKYLRNTLSNCYKQAGYIVTKSGVGSMSLYTDGSFELNPDIYIEKDGRPILIADAKYKTPTASDHYQMQVYLSAHGIKSGILLSPLFTGDEVIIKEYCTSKKAVVREIFLPMHNLTATESFLETIVDRFR